MNNWEFAEKVKHILEYRTLYVNGGWGWPLDAANKVRALMNSYNAQAIRSYKIEAASRDTFAFDCVCMIKAVLWGWSGKHFDHNGGAKYASNGVPDLNADQMIQACGERYDWENIEVGSVVWVKGHIGVYVGDGMVVEATPIWRDGVQMTSLNVPKKGYHYRKWKCWGKLPWVEYLEDFVTYEQFKQYMEKYLAELKDQDADEYAIDAIDWAYKEGIMKGDEHGNVMPQSPIKRQDVAVMLRRYHERFER